MKDRYRNDGNRSRESFNKDWKFFLGDEPNAKNTVFNDANWRKLTLPHDWSIEGKFDEKNPAKPEGGGLPTGIAWYRKDFIAPANFKDRIVTIEFDGVYKNSEVYINGVFLGKRPFGYISFAYELSNYLKPGKNIFKDTMGSYCYGFTENFVLINNNVPDPGAISLSKGNLSNLICPNAETDQTLQFQTNSLI